MQGISSRALRRMLNKGRGTTARRRHFRTKDEILKTDGFKHIATIVPLTDKEFDKMEIFFLVRLMIVKDGSSDREDWNCLLCVFVEGWCLAKVGHVDEEAELIRLFEQAARLWDAALYHKQKTGETLLANLDGMDDALIAANELRRHFNRQELLDVLDLIEKNYGRYAREMLGGEPKSGNITNKDYV